MRIEPLAGHRKYTIYGNFKREEGPWLAFTGEHLDQSSGCYLLGNGYRAYSPVLMRFYNPDSLSPFHAGGRNAYAYCSGDPVNRVDPSGAASITRNPNSLSIASRPWPGPGEIFASVIDNAPAVGNIIGTFAPVVEQMEAIQSQTISNQSFAVRVANTSEFWSNAFSAASGFSSSAENSPFTSIVSIASNIAGVTTYAGLPQRVSALFQSSGNIGDFAGLVVRGVARASGLDLLGSGFVRAGQPLINVARVGVGRVMSTPQQNSNIRV